MARKGARVIDADVVAHELLADDKTCFKKILRVFGRAVIENGKISRQKMAAVVFRQPKKLKALEGIIHPAVVAHIKREIASLRRQKKQGVVVLDVPLLFESGIDALTDVTMVVKASQEKQILRARKQLKLSRSEALARIKSQMPLQNKIRLADIIIDNGGTLTKTKQQVDKIWVRLSQKRKK